jgi:chromate transport protein ChrA
LWIVIGVLFIIVIFYAMLFFAWWTEQPGNKKIKQAIEGSFVLGFLFDAVWGLVRSLMNGEWWKAALHALMLPVALLFALGFLVVDVLGLKKTKEKLERFSPRLARRLEDLPEHVDNPDENRQRRHD